MQEIAWAVDTTNSIVNGTNVVGIDATYEAEIEKYMNFMNKDLICMNFIHVLPNELPHTSHGNGIIFLPSGKTGGGCFSALGKTAGYYRVDDLFENDAGSITQFGAPSGWQMISLSVPGCIAERTVQHEGNDLSLLPHPNLGGGVFFNTKFFYTKFF